jgi:hypothetical protein
MIRAVIRVTKRTDPQFTKLLANHLVNARGFYDWGIDRGLTSANDLRLTVEKRRQEARRLVNGGMSRRQAASVPPNNNSGRGGGPRWTRKWSKTIHQARRNPHRT